MAKTRKMTSAEKGLLICGIILCLIAFIVIAVKLSSEENSQTVTATSSLSTSSHKPVSHIYRTESVAMAKEKTDRADETISLQEEVFRFANGGTNGLTASADTQGQTEKFNLNTATRQELLSIKGLGQAKADAILAYRKANGPFSSLNDLSKVKGIGEKVLALLKTAVYVE